MPDSIRRLALGCLLAGFAGPDVPAWLAQALADGLGGVVLFGSNIGDGTGVAGLTAALRAAAGGEVVIALDEEGGDVTRLGPRRGRTSPGAAALAFLDDGPATEAAYAAIGSRLARAGITLNLAPVLDVNRYARDPVIGARSFTAPPEVAARNVAAAVRGIQRAGVAAGAKYLPGHAATATDSHHEMATVPRSRADFEADLALFRAAIGAGMRAIMTGHVRVPAFDGSVGSLANVSRAITTARLRDEFGFTGTVVIDALELRAIADVPEAFAEALIAGADAIETGAQDAPHLLEPIVAAVARAVDEGRLPVSRLAEAARRTALLATPGNAPELADPPDVSARCLEIRGTLPPLDADGRTLVVLLRDPHGHPGQREVLDAAMRHPDRVIVDAGRPASDGAAAADRPEPYLRTRGDAPGRLMADALTGARI